MVQKDPRLKMSGMTRKKKKEIPLTHFLKEGISSSTMSE